VVAQSSHDGHVTLEDIHIPEAICVCSDQVSGCNIGCDGRRAK